MMRGLRQRWRMRPCHRITDAVILPDVNRSGLFMLCHVNPSARASSDIAPAHNRDARPERGGVAENLTAATQIIRWTGNDTGLVIDVTVVFALAEVCPSSPGRWQCEPADREPFVRSQYRFTFTGASADDPDEPPLTPHEVAALRRWFAAAHDQATEHAADYLRGDGP